MTLTVAWLPSFRILVPCLTNSMASMIPDHSVHRGLCRLTRPAHKGSVGRRPREIERTILIRMEYLRLTCRVVSVAAALCLAETFDYSSRSFREGQLGFLRRSHADGSEFWGSDSSSIGCLLYTSDAADDLLCVDLGGGR